MSKIVNSVCKITEADADTLKQALEMMCKLNNGSLTLIDKNKMMVYCSDLNISNRVSIENEQVVVSGESYSIQDAKESIEQYYEALVTAEEYGGEIEKEENGDLVLMLEGEF